METEKRKHRGKGNGTNITMKINNYSLNYGCLNKKKCNGIYFGFNSYVHPETDYVRDMTKFKYDFERFMNNYIKHSFEPNLSHIIYSIDDRVNNTVNRLNTSFTILPGEISVLFINEVDFNEVKDEIPILLKIMVNYLDSYQGLVFSNFLYK